MKKFCYRKEVPQEETPILLQLERRHTLMEINKGIENEAMSRAASRVMSIDGVDQLKDQVTTNPPLKPRIVSRSVSEDRLSEYSSASTVIITESELSSSWLYKNRKAAAESNEAVVEDAPKATTPVPTAPPEDLGPVVLNDPKMKPVPIKTKKPEKMSSCCCYLVILLIISLCSLGLICAIGGIIYMEVFAVLGKSKGASSSPTSEDNKDLKTAFNFQPRGTRVGSSLPEMDQGNILTMNTSDDIMRLIKLESQTNSSDLTFNELDRDILKNNLDLGIIDAITERAGETDNVIDQTNNHFREMGDHSVEGTLKDPQRNMDIELLISRKGKVLIKNGSLVGEDKFTTGEGDTLETVERDEIQRVPPEVQHSLQKQLGIVPDFDVIPAAKFEELDVDKNLNTNETMPISLFGPLMNPEEFQLNNIFQPEFEETESQQEEQFISNETTEQVETVTDESSVVHQHNEEKDSEILSDNFPELHEDTGSDVNNISDGVLKLRTIPELPENAVLDVNRISEGAIEELEANEKNYPKGPLVPELHFEKTLNYSPVSSPSSVGDFGFVSLSDISVVENEQNMSVAVAEDSLNVSSAPTLEGKVNQNNATTSVDMNRPVVSANIAPIEFLKLLEQERLALLQPVTTKSTDMKFSLSEAMKHLQVLDTGNRFPSSRSKAVTSTRSKNENISQRDPNETQRQINFAKERMRYLQKLRSLMFDRL